MVMIKLAIVGRPNVGKSALFNRICGSRIAIVDEAEGITRDRLYADAESFGKVFQVIDTGGIDPKSKIPFQEEIRRQAEIAMEEADSIVMVVDATVGVTAMDEEVAKLLLRTKKPVSLAINKVDGFAHIDLMHQFYGLGIARMTPVSASQGFRIAELLENAFEGVTFSTEVEPKDKRIKVAIIGRPNVGKSTLTNYLLSEERCIVSPIAGTTRDSIDADLSVDGREYTFIDTAGIRRKRAEHEVVDKFAAVRTERAIERADICVLVLDASVGMTTEEKRIASIIEEQGKGCIILFNKWDLVKGFRMEHCLEAMKQMVPFLEHCPKLFVSALSGRNVDKLFEHIIHVHEQVHRRITTGQLNKFIEKVLQKYHPPMLQGKRLRIYYMAQVDITPPRFVMFVNRPELMTDTYKKYMINQFREEYGFAGVPLLFSLKGKHRKDPDTFHPKSEDNSYHSQPESDEDEE
jgi:GTP-binding protein